MIKKITVAFCGILLVLLFSFLISVTIAANPVPKLLENYRSEEELLSVLNGESFNDLSAEVNELGDKFEYGGLSYYAEALYGKIYTVSTKNLTDMITSKLNTVNLRCLLLELAGNEDKPILLDFETLKKQLVDSKNSTDYRVAILQYLNQYYTYGNTDQLTGTLEKLLDDEDDFVASNALQALFYSDSEKALPFIDEILYSRSTSTGEKTLCRAIDLKAVFLSKEPNESELRRYIDFCNEMLDSKRNVGAVLYGLIDTNTFEAMRVVLNSDWSDDIMKTYCVYNNYNCLSEWLKDGGLTIEKVEFVLKCLSYFPAKQAIPDLQSALDENPDFFANNLQLAESVEEKILYLEKNGEDIFGAWLQ